MARLQEAFADLSPEIGFNLENVQYYPESFGNESADLCFGKLKASVCVDRGSLEVDLLIPGQPKKPVFLGVLMDHWGFIAKSNDKVANVREFFRQHQAQLLALGESLAKGEIPQYIKELLPSDDQNENWRRFVACQEKMQKAQKQ